MSLYNGPPRPGARGGRDQFNWETVKSDKDREFYLGHSVKATTGRWQKGKDVFWYTREKNDNEKDPRIDEIALVKQREEELMMEALGMKPKTIRATIKPQLSKQEMKQLLEGNPAEQEAEEGDAGEDTDRVKGVGFRSGQIQGSGDAEHEIMNGVGVGRQTGANAAQISHPQAGPVPGGLPLPPQISIADLKKIRKAQAKEVRKQEKKAEKKAKKEAKKAKKERKAAKRKESEESDDESNSEPEREAKKPKTERQPERSRAGRRVGGSDDDSRDVDPHHGSRSRTEAPDTQPRQSKRDSQSRDLPKTSQRDRHSRHRSSSPSPRHTSHRNSPRRRSRSPYNDRRYHRERSPDQSRRR